MASLFGSAIAAFCVSAATGNYNNACTHAVDAGTRQIGVRQEFDRVEDGSVQYVSYEATHLLGKDAMSIVATGGYMYKIVRDKSLSFRLPTLGICSSANNEITSDSYRLILQWKW